MPTAKDVFVFTLFCEIFDIQYMKYFMEELGVSFVYNFALRKFDFRGRWSATPKHRRRSKKTQGWKALQPSRHYLTKTFMSQNLL